MTATDADVIESARGADIHEKILTFPDQYETQVSIILCVLFWRFSFIKHEYVTSQVADCHFDVNFGAVLHKSVFLTCPRCKRFKIANFWPIFQIIGKNENLKESGFPQIVALLSPYKAMK